MPNFIISGIPGVDVGPDAARATVEKRIANEIAESEKAARIYWVLKPITEDKAIKRVARQIAEELKDASAAVDATAAGRKGESRVMVAYMNATNNQNAIQEIQRERAGA
jgi:hypothetical protein